MRSAAINLERLPVWLNTGSVDITVPKHQSSLTYNAWLMPRNVERLPILSLAMRELLKITTLKSGLTSERAAAAAHCAWTGWRDDAARASSDAIAGAVACVFPGSFAGTD